MMKISTKGRYALRLMIDLAQHQGEADYITLKEVSARQEVSVRYLELIIAMLLKAGFVKSCRGKAGGYRLVRTPGEYTAGDILKLVEGDLYPVACVNDDCPRQASCSTKPFWSGLYEVIDHYLEGVTLEDLSARQVNNGCDYGAGI